MNNTYEAAMEKSGAAIRAFKAVQEAYRARKIGDAEYLAGRKAYESAMAEYDIAFDTEAAYARSPLL